MLLGNGDGTFQAARSFPAGDGPIALAVADFNGDGRLDVAVADSGDIARQRTGRVDPDGQRRRHVPGPDLLSAGTGPSSIVAGDWTGNGVIDLAVTNTGSDDVTVLMGDGRGGFQALPPISLGDQAELTGGDHRRRFHRRWRARPGRR